MVQLSAQCSAPPAPQTSLAHSSDIHDVECLMTRLAYRDSHDQGGAMVVEHLATGGKRLRARLALSATAGLGGERSSALAWAAAVELLHNATLIHDDIQDADRMRRGRPTTWAVHGTAQAINAGDLMLMLPFVALSELQCDNGTRWHLSRCLAEQACRIVRGQVEDLDMLSSESLDWEAYFRTVEGKTGGLFALPVQGAALLAGRSPDEASALAEAFLPLGTLFQLQDDLLDLYGDKGRELPGADLREGKISALVIAHLSRYPEQRPWLLQLLRTERDLTPSADVAAAIRRFQTGGALADVLGHIQSISHHIHSSAVLAAEPALHAVARQLTARALHPIRHLLAGFP